MMALCLSLRRRSSRLVRAPAVIMHRALGSLAESYFLSLSMKLPCTAAHGPRGACAWA